MHQFMQNDPKADILTISHFLNLSIQAFIGVQKVVKPNTASTIKITNSAHSMFSLHSKTYVY